MEESKEPELRTRSFRNEDYNNRRAFLRSYPLYGGGDQDDQDVETKTAKKDANGKTSNKKPMKKIILAVFHWGEGRVLIFRRLKHKVTFYVITCLPVGLKTRTSLISV
ncbi:hypothetical protein ACH5RR_000211 [Cinchona calisaya]|uniref:Uncharacterized protein n=1 Tax=Cinchona calisaya TaxID=153742 RepID=A0ABD3B001_9GENT